MYFKKIILGTVLVGLIIMGGFAYYVYGQLFTPNTSFLNGEAHVHIPTNATFTDVLAEMKPLLKDTRSFANVAKRKGYAENVKPGHYVIKKGSGNNSLINNLRSANVPVRVRFNNHERLENLAGRLSKQIEPDSLQLIRAFKDTVFLKKTGFSPATALSMYIPNTYEVYWNTSAEAFREKMLGGYNRFWTPSRTKKAEKIGLSQHEVFALAAIVQKETAKAVERPKVAGVYLNRIERGMLLQADPTVIYAKKKTENNFGQVIKRVLYRDLVIDSPYNTYKYAGLPPGPITMPDISSIDAVLDPQQHGYLYFVADVKNFGYHKFASTLSQHNRNKQEYVKWLDLQRLNR
ncbi:MAG: endolytic transglycosylase MltG [Marinirhabdus sp.]